MNRICVIGLDGATWDLILPQDGGRELLTFKNLIKNGAYGKLKTTIPPLTPCAWSSFMTGKNPGKHGQFSFYKLDENYNLDINFDEYRSEATIWEILSRHGKKSCIINVPFTFPPQKIDGYMISGLMTPSLHSQFTYPKELKREILNAIPDFQLMPNSRYSEKHEDKVRFLENIFKLTEIGANVAKYLIKKKKWDFFMVTFMGIDWIQHWYWKYFDKNHPDYIEDSNFKDSIPKLYQKIDNIIGELVGLISRDTIVIIMSDHGFGSYVKDVNVNQWLREKGYLSFKKTPRVMFKTFLNYCGINPSSLINLALKIGVDKIPGRRVRDRFNFMKRFFESISPSWKDIDWLKTKAYSFGYYGSIYINLKGLKTHGSVDPKEYYSVREKIISELKNLQDPETKEFIVDKIWKKEELYWGRKTGRLPDINFSMKNFSYASSMTFALPSGRIFSKPKTLKSGEHRQEGVLIISGRGIKKGYLIKNPRIIDLAPTILHLLGVRPPKDMDGRVLKEIIENREV